MPLVTRLTDRFGLAHPVVLAPMAFAAGGRLAAAVSAAGGLGLVGGGYGNKDWVDAQLDEAGDGTVGCGFITWSLEGSPGLLDHVLERRPRAILLSSAIHAHLRNGFSTLECRSSARCRAVRMRRWRSRREQTSSSRREGKRAVTASVAARSRSCPRSPI